ncbi:MAG: hypothetical protein JXR39_01255 [Marinilabiliaceae bacterium]|nr:hypothetical protein [Marinilabiliaceae bacterium]
MGFFDRWTQSHSNPKEASLWAELTIDHHCYMLEELDIRFDRPVDHRMQTMGPARGNLLAMTLSETPHPDLSRWLTNKHIKKNGEIRFYQHHTNPNEGALLVIRFKDATCLNFRKQIVQAGSSIFTSMAIEPAVVEMANDVFDWHCK